MFILIDKCIVASSAIFFIIFQCRFTLDTRQHSIQVSFRWFYIKHYQCVHFQLHTISCVQRDTVESYKQQKEVVNRVRNDVVNEGCHYECELILGDCVTLNLLHRHMLDGG